MVGLYGLWRMLELVLTDRGSKGPAQVPPVHVACQAAFVFGASRWSTSLDPAAAALWQPPRARTAFVTASSAPGNKWEVGMCVWEVFAYGLLVFRTADLFSCAPQQFSLAKVSVLWLCHQLLSWHQAACLESLLCILQASCITRREYEAHTDGFCVVLPLCCAAIAALSLSWASC